MTSTGLRHPIRVLALTLAVPVGAWQYRTGAQYLSMLGKEHTGGLTLERYPLAPVNEQLHSEDDPWLLWVRTQAKVGGFLRPR